MRISKEYFAETFKYKITLIVLILLTALSTSKAQSYMIGADLSFMKMAEDSGTVFKTAVKQNRVCKHSKITDTIGYD